MQLNGSVVGKNGKKIVLFFVYDNLVVVHFYTLNTSLRRDLRLSRPSYKGEIIN